MKKAIAALLMVSLTASVLAGCGEKETQTEALTSGASTEKGTSENADKKEASKEIVEINYFTYRFRRTGIPRS